MSKRTKVRFNSEIETYADSIGPNSEEVVDIDAESFNTSAKALLKTNLSKVQYQDPLDRTSRVISAPQSSLSKPNIEDNLRRVSIVFLQHIQKCEQRLAKATPETLETGLFKMSKLQKFNEKNFISPQYVYHFIRAPVCKLGMTYSIRKLNMEPKTPTLAEIHTFLQNLFIGARLSAECSIVCLIYVERLMEHANVPLVGSTWRPCLLCGLLLASKVWQDLSSWNSEITEIYPQFSLPSINKLERHFCEEIKWDLYISSSLYAKYYFALRALSGQQEFRRSYNATLTSAPGAMEIEQRSEGVKEMVLSLLSKSL